MPNLPKACVIGAGSSGIAAAKALHDAGIPFDVYEKGDRVGGNWVFKNSNGMSSAYRSLHINTSRTRMEYRDYPMPSDYPDFAHHSQIAAYFDDYVDHFGFRDRIRFGVGVEHAERGSDGVWTVRLDNGEQHRYDALLVANGHHWDPRWPEPAFPGSESFEGEQVHAHHYVDVAEPLDLRGKNVVVLGMGNSAMDIAVEASTVAANVYSAMRRGAYVIPKTLFGKPLDTLALPTWLPFGVRMAIARAQFRLFVGDMESYGLPRPDHKLGEAHPTISAFYLDKLTHGDIKVKPNIAALEGKTVRFVDGTSVEADVIFYCTGYKVTFPFFDEDFISAPGNDLPLYRRVFHPQYDNVFFLALLQPLGATMPLAEAQGKWIASYLRGEYHLPSRPQVEADIARERERMFKRYVASKRHTMQVDFDDYLAELAKERQHGAARARAAGNSLPVPPRAHDDEAAAVEAAA